MTVEPPTPTPERNWWPRTWFRDELFWRDVASRTIAGLIAALLAAFVIWGIGVAIGVFSSPGAVEGFISVLQLLIIFGALVSFVLELRVALSTDPRPEGIPRWVWLGSAFGTLVLAVFMTLDFINRLTGGPASIFLL